MSLQAVAEASVKQKEEHFHDAWAASLDPREVMVDESWEAVTCPEHQWIKAQLGELKGRKVLDLGCGAGEAAVWFAKQGANVVASDLSSEFLDLVRRVAELHGVTVETHHGDSDYLNFADNTFDVVYAGNVLHHVDLDKTLEQIHRILKPGGKVVTWDPLRHNPVINVYRRMAMPVRTEDEFPLAIKDINAFRRRFVDVKYDCFWFFTLWIFVRFYLIERVHPSKERYWKKIIREHKRLAPKYNRLRAVDNVVLRTVPFLKRYCWNVAVAATKPAVN
jgi:SAM-dependent methyltransferase